MVVVLDVSGDAVSADAKVCSWDTLKAYIMADLKAAGLEHETVDYSVSPQAGMTAY